MRNKKSILLEYGAYLLILVFVLFIAPNYLIEKVAVDGSSMENTLQDKEHILIEKVSRYFKGPERFDIVVFTRHNSVMSKTYVKRVIGLPGETVQIIGDDIYINGELVEEDFGKDPMTSAGTALHRESATVWTEILQDLLLQENPWQACRGWQNC